MGTRSATHGRFCGPLGLRRENVCGWKEWRNEGQDTKMPNIKDTMCSKSALDVHLCIREERRLEGFAVFDGTGCIPRTAARAELAARWR